MVHTDMTGKQRLLDYISYLGKNRARQYRKLPRLLDSLATLEKQAADLAPPFNMLLDQYEVGARANPLQPCC